MENGTREYSALNGYPGYPVTPGLNEGIIALKKIDESPWLTWAREIQAIGQTGLTFSASSFDTQRYGRLMEIAADIIQSHTTISKCTILDNFRIQPGYATTKVDVRGAIVQDGKILLVQERSDECWCMPGGWADVGEAPAEMVAREVLEESGYIADVKKVIGVYDANREGRPLEFYHAYKIVFLCEITGGEARTSDETMAVDFFEFDKLPTLSINRTNNRHLNDIQAYLDDSDSITVFD